MIKVKTLFQNTTEHVTVKLRLRYNSDTDVAGVYTEFHEYAQKIYFKVSGKLEKTFLPRPPKGFIRHHIAYHFNDPDKGVVIISRALHMKIHNPHNWNNPSVE
jgi:hypothetical protein